MTTATLASKFQISMPKKIRDAFNFQPGQAFEFIAVGRSPRPVAKVTINDLAGSAKGANPADYRDRSDRPKGYIFNSKSAAQKASTKPRT